MPNLLQRMIVKSEVLPGRHGVVAVVTGAGRLAVEAAGPESAGGTGSASGADATSVFSA